MLRAIVTVSISVIFAASNAFTASLALAQQAQATQPTTTQTRFEAIYLTNTNSKENRTKAIKNTMLTVGRWYAGQLDGAAPTLVGGKNPTVLTIRNTENANKMAHGLKSNGYETGNPESIINGWREKGLIKPDVIPIIFVEGRGGNTCGWTQQSGLENSNTPTDAHIIIPMDTCRIYPSTSSKFPDGATYLVAHEMGHALGAEHSYSNSRDLLYDSGNRNWGAIRLSPTERKIISTSPAIS
jgi:hypothetical protein